MKVSIAMVTYNHGRHISKALDSILMQRTNFDYEIVIGEDCSTDGTRAIVIDYRDRYPEKFRLLLNEKNLGMHKNGVQTLLACTGEYVAMLDGDDYWTSSEKLQRQVDFLDSHPDYSTCFHDALIVHEDGSSAPIHYRPSQKAISTVEDLFLDNYIPTCSVMFRRGLFGKAPEWSSALKMGDWLIHILNALHGKIGYLDETMAVYVVHRGGVWSTKDWRDHEPAIIELFEALYKYLDPIYAATIRKVLRWRNFTLMEKYENGGDVAHARRCAIKALIKHVQICLESYRCSRTDLDRVNLLPDQIKSISGVKLGKKVIRLCIMPLVEPYPIFYKFLKITARALNMNN